jgi:hypothetical protein
MLKQSTILIAIALLAAGTGPALAGERDRLNACQAMVERAGPEPQAGDPRSTAFDQAELQKCRQIIKEWTLRDSRMSVDEQGRPLR